MVKAAGFELEVRIDGTQVADSKSLGLPRILWPLGYIARFNTMEAYRLFFWTKPRKDQSDSKTRSDHNFGESEIVQPDGQAKIVDFGIARVQSSNAETGLTRTGNVIGTIHYIAPERLMGQPFDGRSDIFSTGVMLYLLLAGQLPFVWGRFDGVAEAGQRAAPPAQDTYFRLSLSS